MPLSNIGKGIDSRLQSHLKAAEKVGAKHEAQVLGCDTQSVLEDATAGRAAERLARILELRNLGFDHIDVARFVARRKDERTAFTVDAFLIRSVYGVNGLTNQVEARPWARGGGSARDEPRRLLRPREAILG